jgi:hypothetical protein
MAIAWLERLRELAMCHCPHDALQISDGSTHQVLTDRYETHGVGQGVGSARAPQRSQDAAPVCQVSYRTPFVIFGVGDGHVWKGQLSHGF